VNTARPAFRSQGWSRVLTATVPAMALVLLLAACRGAGTGSATSASQAASASQASESVEASGSTEPSAEPTDDLGPFTCALPVAGNATTGRAQIVDVRVGTHDDYDRVVIEFEAGVPAFTLDETTPPLLKDPSDLPLDVEGNAFWQLVMQGGTRVSPAGVETYDGKTDFMPGFVQLTELIEGGDFEAVSTWYFGLESEACVRVLTLTDPSRLVFDVEH
jgi:hypothetical protein